MLNSFFKFRTKKGRGALFPNMHVAKENFRSGRQNNLMLGMDVQRRIMYNMIQGLQSSVDPEGHPEGQKEDLRMGLSSSKNSVTLTQSCFVLCRQMEEGVPLA